MRPNENLDHIEHPAEPGRRAICVFCGSRAGAQVAYCDQARLVGQELALRGIELVFGGGQVGLMGAVADGALEAGGRVVGVIPEPLAVKEVAHQGLNELHVVANMHERKAMMMRLSSAFLTLPGGVGTFEEFFEILSWATLGLHGLPLGVLNVAGYFDPLLAMLEHGANEGFINRDHLGLLRVATGPQLLIDELLAALPKAPEHSWIGISQT
jgi:uncharacterized protein (TIGR00730 family)